METTAILEQSKQLTDEEVVDRVRAGDLAMYEVIMRRYNQRLYRIARAILHDDVEAEDVMQDAYVRAYTHLEQFAGRSAFSTWLSRIAVHEALTRLRSRNRHPQVDVSEYDGEISMKTPNNALDPEKNASSGQLREFLEEAVLKLPENYRTVVMVRDIEELSTAETAEALDLTQENVKIRLHRGHGMIRNWLFERIGPDAKEAFPFMGIRCDRVVQNVFDRLTNLTDATQ
ncbi:MAG TPA: RNA polymerase sigma factor [Edaphobacter sp.]|uniref:RNA polymerase sigma factor n=1 Tax=Edaphobacter sp. TaxID=1934404 RepID=UPI002BC78A81|nr:RNA polymerase sigma factor [Edaphobacter sp.]HUZ93325.1 RNA polymerase sigma factor [Edaphobacter sp.]